MNISQVWLHGQPDAPALCFVKNTDVLIKQQTSCDCTGGTAQLLFCAVLLSYISTHSKQDREEKRVQRTAVVVFCQSSGYRFDRFPHSIRALWRERQLSSHVCFHIAQSMQTALGDFTEQGKVAGGQGEGATVPSAAFSVKEHVNNICTLTTLLSRVQFRKRFIPK